MEKNYYHSKLNEYLHCNNLFYTISITLILLVSTFHGWAQSQQKIIFSQFSLAEGLSQSVVFQTIQNKDGFLCFDTHYGLGGFKVQKYRQFEQLVNYPSINYLSKNNY